MLSEHVMVKARVGIRLQFFLVRSLRGCLDVFGPRRRARVSDGPLLVACLRAETSLPPPSLSPSFFLGGPLCSSVFAMRAATHAWLLVIFCLLPSATSTLYAGTVYVYYPDTWRSGGPAALHHLHHALNRLGFSSQMTVSDYYLDPQWSRRMKELPPPEAVVPGDIIVIPAGNDHLLRSELVTEYQRRDVRFYAYTLAICMPEIDEEEKNRLGQDLDQHELIITGLDLGAQTQGGLFQQLPVGHYVSRYYDLPMHEDYYFLPPVQAFYYLYTSGRRSRYPKADNLILLDQDSKTLVHLPDDCIEISRSAALDVTRPLPGVCNVIILKGFNSREMIILYKRAKIVYDLYLNGPERAVQEGILFDAVPVVTIEGNGFDAHDFPLPSFSRIDPAMPNHTVSVLTALLRHYDDIYPQYVPFKETVLSLAGKYDAVLAQVFDTAAFEFKFAVRTRLEERDSMREQHIGYNSSITMEDRMARESSVFASAISILYHLPMARIVFEIESEREKKSFCRRWQLLLRNMKAYSLYRGGHNHGFALTIVAASAVAESFVRDVRVVSGTAGNAPIFLGTHDVLSAGRIAKEYRCTLDVPGIGTVTPKLPPLVPEANCDHSVYHRTVVGDVVPYAALSPESCSGIAKLHTSTLGRVSQVFARNHASCSR